MNKLILTMLFTSLTLFTAPSNAAVFWGPNGALYGNVCVVPNVGSWYVNPQPVGTYCFVQGLNLWGFIANV